MGITDNVELGIKFNDSGVTQVLQAQIDLIKQQQKAFSQMEQAVNAVYKDAVQQSEAYNRAIKENLEQLKAQDVQLKKTSLSSEIYEGVVDKLTEGLGAFRNVGLRAIDGLRSVASGFVNSARGGTGFIRVLKLIRAAIIGTGIGALVVAITGVVTALLRVESVGKSVRATFAGLSASFDAFTGRLATIGQAVIGVVTGTKSLGQAAREAGSAFKGVGKEMSQAFTAGKNLQISYEALNTRARELSVNVAENERQIAALTATANDESKSAAARIKATQAAAGIERKNLNDQLALERESLRLKNEEIALRGRLGSTETLENERAEILIRIKGIQADLINQSAEYRGAVNSLKDAEAERLARLQEAYQGLLKDLDERLQKAQLGSLDGLDKIIAERDVAVQEIFEFRATIEEAAKRAGKEIPPQVKEQFDLLFGLIQSEFKKAVDKYKADNAIEDFELLPGLQDKKKAEALAALTKENVIQVFDAAKSGAEEGLSFFDEIRNKFASALGIKPEEFDLVAGLIEQSISRIDDIIISGTQVQIAQNEALISSLENRVRAAEVAYKKEAELQEQGLANSAALRERELQAEQRQLQDAQRKRQELEKKALRQQLISDSLAQASQLALASAKVLGSESSKGLIGIVTAAAGIALLFRIIAQARANAAQSAQASIPRFRKGGILEGNSHEAGGIPILVGGVRLVEAEGGEMIVSKKNTQPNVRFLDKLNKGEYAGLDLHDVAERAKSQQMLHGFRTMATQGSRVNEQYQRHKSGLEQRILEKAINQMREELVREAQETRATIERRPVVKPIGESYKLEWVDGNVKNVQIVRSKP